MTQPTIAPAVRQFGLASMLAAAALAAPVFVDPAEAQYRRQQRQAQPQQQQQNSHPGMVNIDGYWVSSAWCNATVPSGGGHGGPGGPGSGLCGSQSSGRGR